MATICAISDCHLGYRHKFKAKRLEDYASAFGEAVEKALSKKPDVIILLGDLLHHPKPDPKSFRITMKSLKYMAEKTNVICLIGNHEIEGHLGTTYTPVYSDLHENIHVLTSENPTISLKIQDKRYGFHGFQFIRNRDICENMLKSIAKANNENELNILCLHQAVEKYLSPFEISLRSLRATAPSFDLILVGHVHRHQKIKEVSDVTPAYYVGSTEKISFNEAENDTGFMVFSSDKFSDPEFVKIKSAIMKRIKIDLGRSTAEKLNTQIRHEIEKNTSVDLLQINVDAEIEGGLLDIRRDFSEYDEKFTVLDINVAPQISEKTIQIEKFELSEEVVGEYLDKSGMGKNQQLREACLEMYGKYA